MMRPEPPVSDVSAPFWDASRSRQLVMQWCIPCDAVVFYPRATCPRCLGGQLEWRSSRGTGVVYAVSVEHRPPAGEAPYAVALVDLDEGARMMTNVVGCDPLSVTIGMPVSVTWEALPDGRNLPLFAPTEPSDA